MDAEGLKRLFFQAVPDVSRVQEIRIRAGRPVFFLRDGKEEELAAVADRALIREILGIFSRHSLYAHEAEIRQGFLTIEGGHRVGIAGQAVVEGGGTTPGLRTIKDIASLNIRLAHECKGCADGVLPYLLDSDGEIENTLILSPPGAGKTTLLRDLIRQLSDGAGDRPGVSVSVVDERSEIGACVQGIPQCDLGRRTDIMDGCPKTAGMLMMIRSMAPRVLAVDEIGTMADLEAMRYVVTCGCRILATVHGTSMEDILQKPVLKEMVEEGIFSRYVVLSRKPVPGTVKEVLDGEGSVIDGEKTREREGSSR